MFPKLEVSWLMRGRVKEKAIDKLVVDFGNKGQQQIWKKIQWNEMFRFLISIVKDHAPRTNV